MLRTPLFPSPLHRLARLAGGRQSVHTQSARHGLTEQSHSEHERIASPFLFAPSVRTTVTSTQKAHRELSLFSFHTHDQPETERGSVVHVLSLLLLPICLSSDSRAARSASWCVHVTLAQLLFHSRLPSLILSVPSFSLAIFSLSCVPAVKVRQFARIADSPALTCSEW